MKTRFFDLLKVKKQRVSDIQQQLQDVQNRKKRLKEKIAKVDREVADFKMPQKGDFLKMQLSRKLLNQLLMAKEELLENLSLRNKQIEGLKTLYQEATIEYEKIAYLHQEEIDKELQKRHYQEAKRLDEIANILFVNQREKEEA
jgi:flagellar export protein FliJ